jgi:hypothetical protein
VYVHYEKKLIYLAHPRTASIATKLALSKIGFGQLQRHHSGFESPDCMKDLDVLTNKNFHREEWTVFTTVRNHFDATVSWVFYRNRGGKILDQEALNCMGSKMKRDVTKILDSHRHPPGVWGLETFEHGLSNGWTKKNSMWHLHSKDADVVLRFETIKESLETFLAPYDLKPDLPFENVSCARVQRHYREFYTEASRDYVQKRFEKELAEWNYSW